MPSPELAIDYYKLETKFFKDRVQHTKFRSDSPQGERLVKVVETWHRDRELGRGGSGTVFLERSETEELRAVKEIAKDKNTRIEVNYERELMAMAVLAKAREHDALFVQLLGWYESDNYIHIAMEYISQGHLRHYMEEERSESDAKIVIRQLLEGLVVIHQKGFAHRDLKPENIFVVSISPIWVKIGDFGLAKLARTGTAFRTRGGTMSYIAPEVEIDPSSDTSEYTNAVDLWSIGCITHELLTRELPFRGIRALIRYCSCFEFPRKSMLSKNISQKGIEFVESTLAYPPENRIAAKDALDSEWLRPECGGAGLKTGEGPAAPEGPTPILPATMAEEEQLERQRMAEEEELIALEVKRHIEQDRQDQERAALEKRREELELLLAEIAKKKEIRESRRRARKNDPKYLEREANRSHERSKKREGEFERARREEVEFVRRNAGLDEKPRSRGKRSVSFAEPSKTPFVFVERSWTVPGGVPMLIQIPPTPPPGAPMTPSIIHVDPRNYFPPIAESLNDNDAELERKRDTSPAMKVLEVSPDDISETEIVVGKPFEGVPLAPKPSIAVKPAEAVIEYGNRITEEPESMVERDSQSVYYGPKLPQDYSFPSVVFAVPELPPPPTQLPAPPPAAEASSMSKRTSLTSSEEGESSVPSASTGGANSERTKPRRSVNEGSPGPAEARYETAARSDFARTPASGVAEYRPAMPEGHRLRRSNTERAIPRRSRGERSPSPSPHSLDLRSEARAKADITASAPPPLPFEPVGATAVMPPEGHKLRRSATERISPGRSKPGYFAERPLFSVELGSTAEIVAAQGSDALTQVQQLREGLRLETPGLATTATPTTRSIESKNYSREHLSTNTATKSSRSLYSADAASASESEFATSPTGSTQSNTPVATLRSTPQPATGTPQAATPPPVSSDQILKEQPKMAIIQTLDYDCLASNQLHNLLMRLFGKGNFAATLDGGEWKVQVPRRITIDEICDAQETYR